jgi:hypothetical protein
MRTLATFPLPLADSWQVSVGGGWIAVMLIGMALCFLAMVVFAGLMRNGVGWPTCGRWWPQESTRRDILTSTPARRPDPAANPDESEARR